MGGTHLKEYQWDEVVTLVISRIDKNDTAGIKDIILGHSQFSGYQNGDIEIIASKLIKTGEYERLDKEGEVYISRNRNIALNKTIILTNEAVADSIKFQKKIGNWSLLITIVSVAFIGITIVQTYLDNTERRLRGIEQSIINLQRTLKRSDPSPQYLDSSILQKLSELSLQHYKRP